ncbi:MAG TPA: prolipoprotein diacylglyceryl transferase [Ruminococcaceae bacterium]|nr:prolipoprotein diacylglyceryl transferase [Oscillospiraceae bacterium]
MDSTVVTFTGLDRTFTVSSILAQFNLFGQEITVRWYGAIIAFGFLLAVLMGGRMAYKWKMSLDKMIDVLIYGTLGGIIGARLYYVIFRWSYYSQHLDEIVQIWNGGLAIYGGIIGGLLAAFITCRINKLNFYNLLDCAGVSLLIGQGIGRWGNFANQEAFGTNTTMPWGMKSEKTVEYLLDNQTELKTLGVSVDPYAPVHPTFLYESLWCLGSFIILYIMYRKFRKFSGQLFLSYGVLYGTGRAIIEGFRTDSLYIGSTSLRVSQLLSMVVVAVFLTLLIIKLIQTKKHPQPIEGVDFFPEEEKKDEKSKKNAKLTQKDLTELARKREERLLAKAESEKEPEESFTEEKVDETVETSAE